MFLTHVPKDPDCKVCELTKTTTNSVQEAVVSTVRSWSSSTKVDDAITADQKVLKFAMRRTNLASNDEMFATVRAARSKTRFFSQKNQQSCHLEFICSSED